jgi:hypothetical protein
MKAIKPSREREGGRGERVRERERELKKFSDWKVSVSS